MRKICIKFSLFEVIGSYARFELYYSTRPPTLKAYVLSGRPQNHNNKWGRQYADGLTISEINNREFKMSRGNKTPRLLFEGVNSV